MSAADATGGVAPAVLLPVPRDLRPLRVLIVEDHRLLAESLAYALGEDGMVARAAVGCTREEILEEGRAFSPDVVLLDLDLGASLGSGLSLVDPLGADGAIVLMLTGTGDHLLLAECLEAGAAGVIAKAQPFHDLVGVIRKAAAGEGVLDPARRQEWLTRLRARRAEERKLRRAFEWLTPREREVLVALAEGKSAGEIAESASVAVSTVRTQIQSVLTKLGVGSQLAAVAFAHRSGWLAGERAGDGS